MTIKNDNDNDRKVHSYIQTLHGIQICVQIYIHEQIPGFMNGYPWNTDDGDNHSKDSYINGFP